MKLTEEMVAELTEGREFFAYSDLNRDVRWLREKLDQMVAAHARVSKKKIDPETEHYAQGIANLMMEAAMKIEEATKQLTAATWVR